MTKVIFASENCCHEDMLLVSEETAKKIESGELVPYKGTIITKAMYEKIISEPLIITMDFTEDPNLDIY